MTERRIPPREAIEVFVNENDTISIKQISLMGQDDCVVAVHPEDVPRLIQFLEETREEILNANEAGGTSSPPDQHTTV